MFCPKCGKEIPEGNRFCGSCGAAAQPSTSSAPRKPQKPPREKKKLPLKKLLIPVLCLAVLAAVIFAASALFGRKTVYLVSRQVTDNAALKQSIKTEYDELGRTVSVKNTYKYHSMSEYDSTFQKEYTFDKDGQVLSVEVRDGGDAYELEYNYDKNGVLESIECGRQEAEVECDKDGRITEISWDDGGVEYSYFKSGALEEIDLDYDTVAYNYVYDEDGHLLEQTNYVLGEKQSVTRSVYTKDGKLSVQESLSYAEGKLISEIVTTYYYDKSGLPERIELTVTMDGDDISLYLEAEDDGLLREFYVVDAEADKAILEDYGEDDLDDFLEMIDEHLDGDPMMAMEYDEQGNLLESRTMVSPSETTYEYVAVKVPRGYRIPSQQDPLYFLPPIY